MGNVSTLVFDLDGTISDPSLGILRSLNFAFEEHGFPSISHEQVRAVIGPQLDEALRSFCPSADSSTITSLIQKYRERYAEIGYSENTLYLGVPEAIDSLRSAGLQLGVCTSKRKDFAVKILSMFHLDSQFSFINGGDVGIEKQEQLCALLGNNAIDHQSIMIGDRAVDVSSAKTNGLRSVGVLWGFGDLEELCGAGADKILKETSELERLAI